MPNCRFLKNQRIRCINFILKNIFKHKQQNYTKPSPRKESLPEWAYSGYTIKDELVDGDVDKRFKNKLEKIRAKNSTP